MAKVKLARGLQAAYNARKDATPSTLDPDTIYCCTDTGNIYLGTDLLFEPSAFISASILGKIITFTQHGEYGVNSSSTLSLSNFATLDDVKSAVSGVYRDAGSLSPSSIGSSYLVGANEGKVYNITGDFTIGSETGQVFPNLFIDAVSGNTYPAGTNIVVVKTVSSSSIYSKASGVAQAGTVYYERTGTEEPYTYTEVEVRVGDDVSSYYYVSSITPAVYKFDVLSGCFDSGISANVGTLNTDNSTSQAVSSSESFSNNINLHKVSKTGDYDDLLNAPEPMYWEEL